MSSRVPDQHHERDGFLVPSRPTRDGRAASSFSVLQTNKTVPTSFPASGNPPGSFSTELRSTGFNRSESRPQLTSFFSTRSQRPIADDHDIAVGEKRQAELIERIEKEIKIKIGSENLLEALNAKNAKQTKDQRLRVERELNDSNRKIAILKLGLEAELQRSQARSPSPHGKLSTLYPTRSQSHHELDQDDPFKDEADTESPTFVLSEILQSLEAENLSAEYYVQRANNLVDLLKRHATLKYDLAWSIFGIRMQILLLSDHREVVAASYRVMRHAITDRKSLSIMRSLHTDHLVMMSLVKDSKASVEREQALKFVRAFLDVKDGTQEISKGIARTLVAIAEQTEDRMRNICVLTLAELLIRDPALVLAAGGIGILTEALSDGAYQPAQSLTSAFVYLLDTPGRRAYLHSGHELESPLAVFTDGTSFADEDKLKANGKVIAAMLKTWQGMLTLSNYNSQALQSLVTALHIPSIPLRDVILEIFFEVLGIRTATWSTAFLAGRRLTTYSRFANVKNPDTVTNSEDATIPNEELVEHFTAVLLLSVLRCGILEALLDVVQVELDARLKRKATLLMSEILSLAHCLLPRTLSEQAQALPSLFARLSGNNDDRQGATAMIYQIDSVSKKVFRTIQEASIVARPVQAQNRTRSVSEPTSKDEMSSNIEEAQFRAVVIETQVLATVNYSKWNWDLIQKIIDGPLLNSKRLEEATKTNKFLKRLMGFYRPFKYRFSDMLNTKHHQRYVRVGCSLIRTLLQTPEGIKYLADDKLLRQIAECLAQVDPLSGIVSNSPLFSADRLTETLAGGYFAMLGVLGSASQGLKILERWKMINMFYHIVGLRDRDDLKKILLTNMDYSLDSHLRIILSKALTSGSMEVRIYCARILRKFATRQQSTELPSTILSDTTGIRWAIQLLITQLYDPEVEVCGMAVKILEEACNDPASLEYVVKCRPALDHLGEIGAPLLLRFLSTSIGYLYLEGLDYISQEMDDWFLGRNETYAIQVEASLAKALSHSHRQRRQQTQDQEETPAAGVAPPHFYRELTRTAEGCKLLEEKGHFAEFVATINTWMDAQEDPELILKVKGCVWAVANIGAMELGARFLETTNAVEMIVKIAEESEIMSMRGTAFFALGLISRSVHGQELLAECKWDVTIDDEGCSRGICLPTDFKKLFMTNIRPNSKPDITTARAAKLLVTDDDPTIARILTLINDLSNSVLAKRRAAEIHNLKARKAPAFQQPRMYHKAMRLLEQHHYRLPALKFVLELFDKRLIRQIVLEDEEDSDEGDDVEEEEDDDDDDDESDTIRNDAWSVAGSVSVQ